MNMNPNAPLANFIDLLLDAVCIVDEAGRFVFVSAACERIFGYRPAEMLGQPMIDMVLPEDRPRTLAVAAQIMSGQLQTHFENRYLRKDGRIVHIMWSARWSASDRLRIAVARDVSELKQAQARQVALYAISEAAHTARDLPSLFGQLHQIIAGLLPVQNFSLVLYDAASGQLSFPYYVDVREPAPQAKPAAGTLCEEVIRRGQALLLTPDTLEVLPEPLRELGRHWRCWLGVPLSAPAGTIGVLVLKSYAGGAQYTEQDKELLQFVSTQVAIAVERQQLYARLQYMAQYDELTGLANRSLLLSQLQALLARATADGSGFVLLYLDLDKFKQVNDRYGHAVGDGLLQQVARQLRQCVRDSDTVARMGGDEFVVLLDCPPARAPQVAANIRDALAGVVQVDGHLLPVVPSIGMAFFPEHGQDAQQLLRHADDDMYAIKKRGRTLPE